MTSLLLAAGQASGRGDDPGLVVEQRLRHPGPAAGQAARLDLKSAAAGVGAAVALDRDGCGAAAFAAP